MKAVKALVTICLMVMVLMLFYLNSNTVKVVDKGDRFGARNYYFATSLNSESTYRINIPTYDSLANQIPIEIPQFNSNGIGSMGYTDSSKSTFHLKDDKDIHVGDLFSFIIESRDENGRHRVLGGDFWYATIKIGYCSAAGKILDFKNGTYEAVFFAACPGRVDVSIILVHTVESVHFYKNTIWPMEDRKLWNATYKVGDKEEYGICRMHNIGVWENQCEYPHPTALGGTLMLCDAPPTLPCSSLLGIRSKGDEKELLAKEYTSLLKRNKDLFKMKINFGELNNGTKRFTILESDDELLNEQNSLMSSIERPKCVPDIPEPISDGFWYRNRWNSFACRSKLWSRTQIRRCTKNKRLIFLGDSTTKQWCEKLLTHLHIDVPAEQLKRSYNIVTESLNLTFQFHPFNLGNGMEDVDKGMFEVDFLEALSTDTCNYAILISPWAHYEVWTKEAYATRLEHVRDAVVQFRKKCPDTKFIVKGSHPRRHSSKSLQFDIAKLTSDVLLYEFRRLMHDTFHGMGVHFIDIWDMNLAYDYPNTIHMPLEVAIQELFMYFSHICPDDQQ